MRTALLPLLFLLPFNSSAQKEVDKTVLAVIDSFFAAMTERDTAAMAQMVVREGLLFQTNPKGATPTRIMSFETYMSQIAQRIERHQVRYWNEKVHVYGTLASVAIQREFLVDGKLSHCGTGLFTLVLEPYDGWRIASVALDRQVEGCPPSPLGPFKP